MCCVLSIQFKKTCLIFKILLFFPVNLYQHDILDLSNGAKPGTPSVNFEKNIRFREDSLDSFLGHNSIC